MVHSHRAILQMGTVSIFGSKVATKTAEYFLHNGSFTCSELKNEDTRYFCH